MRNRIKIFLANKLGEHEKEVMLMGNKMNRMNRMNRW